MAVSFVDTSALLKLYVIELGSVWMKSAVYPNGITISELTLAEVGAVLARSVRMTSMSARHARTAWQTFRRDYRRFDVMNIDRRSLLDAALLASRSPVVLRSFDAIQLEAARRATRLARAAGLPEPVVITADGRMEAAAQALGFTTDNPLNHI